MKTTKKKKTCHDIEKLMGARKKWNVGNKRKHVHEVEWRGCSPSNNAWEPLTNLVGFEGEIANINKKCEQAHMKQPINIARTSAKKKADERAKKEQEELRVCKEQLKKDKDMLSNEIAGAKEGTDVSVASCAESRKPVLATRVDAMLASEDC